MTTKQIWLGVLLTLVLAGCVQSAGLSPLATPAPSPLASPQSISDAYLVYHRSGGLTGSDDTWIIDLQGKLTQQGSNASSQLTAAQRDALDVAIRDARFMELGNSFLDKNTCCDRYEYTITITANSQSKTVRTIDGSPVAPPKLMQLIGILNQLVVAPATP
jgi:hypothetical protein